MPAGTSMKNLIHFDQLVKTKRPVKFDYGREYNIDYYGQAKPPEYSLANMKTDVGIFWSLGDEFVPPGNVKQLIRELGPFVKKNHFIDDAYYTHLHFAVGLVNPRYLYPELLGFLRKYIAPAG